MCCFAKPVCLTFIEVKFMGKKKCFSLLEPLLFFFQWALLVQFLEQDHHRQGRWWHLLLSVVASTPTLAFPSAFINQNSFQAVIQSPLQIFNRNIKHLIISKGRDAAWWPWKANMQAKQGSLVHGLSKVQLFCAGVGGKTNTGCAQCCSVTMGNSFLRRGRKSRIPLFVIWVRKFAGGIMEEARNFIQKAGTFFDVLIFCSNEGFFLTSWVEHPCGKFPTFVVA